MDNGGSDPFRQRVHEKLDQCNLADVLKVAQVFMHHARQPFPLPPPPSPCRTRKQRLREAAEAQQYLQIAR